MDDKDKHSPQDLPQPQGVAPSAVPPAQDAAAVPSQPPLPTVALPAQDPDAPASVGLSAHDVDLIEKVWVEKAKLVVAQTMGDPYRQNDQLQKIKADYIKKRYNKDIKVAGE